MARPTDDQVRALAVFAVRAINSALLNDYADDEDGEMILQTAGEVGLFDMLDDTTALVDIPEWLLGFVHAAGQHTLTNEDGNGE
jgi:hypothetical protein